MTASPLRYARALDYILSNADKELPGIEIDSENGLYMQQFFTSGLRIKGVEPFGEPPGNPFLQDRSIRPVEEVVLPYQSASFVWCPQALTFIPRVRAQRWLELFYDWLPKGGLLFFAVLEGEGDRSVTVQGVMGAKKRMEVCYQPPEVSSVLSFCGFQVIDAWREGPSERKWIHVLARKGE